MSALSPEVQKHLIQIRRASRDLRQTSLTVRNQVLEKIFELLKEKESEILAANQKDVASLKPSATEAFRDRLGLSSARLGQMRDSLKDVIALPDPIGATEEKLELKNGLKLRRVRAPLGVILMVFEARPNVITEAFSLAFKSGNAFILRGGSESLQTSKVLYSLIDQALKSAGLNKNIFWGVTDPSRELSQSLMKQHKMIDVLVPRGGDSLIEYVTKHATIPMIKNDRGLCHVYLHEDGDISMAAEIVLNAKTQRPGVCNSAETLLVHERQSAAVLKIYEKLAPFKVQWFGCDKTLAILKGKDLVFSATPETFDTEYLDLKISCKVVSSLDEALEHIEQHGSRHSEAIITNKEATARTFQNSIDAAVVYWNASTRFTDGYQFGLGGELGISTQKLQVRGPVGLKELTSLRWLADGTGQIRS